MPIVKARSLEPQAVSQSDVDHLAQSQTSIDQSCVGNTTNISKILTSFDIHIPTMMTTGMSLDSREVVAGNIFIAIVGHQVDGRTYIDRAIENGAVIVLKDTVVDEEHGQITQRENTLVIAFFELAKQIGQISSEYFGNASYKMHGLAITGTNGKTSIAHICASLSSLIGCEAGSIGTMGVNYYAQPECLKKIAETINTSPDVITTHKLCQQLKTVGAKRFCIEASSHGLHQHRLDGLCINTAIFTNLTLDHLDYHGSMAAYGEAKRLLLKHINLNSMVVNIDDPESTNWLKECPQQVSVCIYSCASTAPIVGQNQLYCWASNLHFDANGCRFDLASSWGSTRLNLGLIGAFNVSNTLASIAALLMQGESFDAIIKAVAQLSGVPGRMELFDSVSRANIIVDYAHTPDALQQALVAAREHAVGDLWVVFGCGGDRDKSKRPQMGKIAEQWADRVVITQDNSRTEAPQSIVSDVLNGLTGSAKVVVELDRKTAIEQAFRASHKDDLILVAGKGHEEYLEINGVREYYNERDFVSKLTSETIL